MKSTPVLFINKEECCGCTACYAICRSHAIIMIEDVEGFLYPQINTKECIQCYLCITVCPLKNEICKKTTM